MIYRCFHPSIHLRDFIRDYLLIHFEFTSFETPPVKPYPACPKQGIIFYIRGSVVSTNPLTGSSQKRAKTVIFGQPVTRQDLHLSNDYLAISVRFQPGALYKFLGVPMSHFIQKNEDAEMVIGPEIKTIHEQLEGATSYETMLVLLEEFLWTKIRKLKENIHPADKIGQILSENPQSFALDNLARVACLSTSQLERRFLQQIGVPPKFYARICRFYNAYLLKQRSPTVPWLDIAWQTGYNDYQHMVKDFKAFAGGTPNCFIKEDATSPEQSLSLNPQFKYD